MEQKKILWIVLAVSVFVLIIFGTAILLYSPSRGAEATLQQASAVVPAQNTARQGTTIDPDSWVRDPGTTPGLDSPVDPAGSGVNLTIVNRNESVTNYGALDVTGLTRNQESEPAGSALSPESIPGQTAKPVDTKPAGTAKNAAAEKPVQTTRVATAAAPVKKTQQAPAKKPAKKTVLVTDYWIQAGSYSSKLNAERARTMLADRYLNAEIFTRGSGDSTTYRVRVGPYKSKAEADYWLGTVKTIKDFADSYVSEVKTRK
jgi:cell division septation protein DedD